MFFFFFFVCFFPKKLNNILLPVDSAAVTFFIPKRWVFYPCPTFEGGHVFTFSSLEKVTQNADFAPLPNFFESLHLFQTKKSPHLLIVGLFPAGKIGVHLRED